ncbi:uncharacterized protein J4E92_004758 [Alternaria infectoria]|uniref:uncharacterized protein n=1 Tax=Alternaria infectoria TaxID=45303 RepID=UPI002220E28A|nr:uncharacterized protein J4E92_004758 [Alternaria infectoria]KAI4930924.1 hypothetical protein J4E92_004758 [Alternaria infectoria]
MKFRIPPSSYNRPSKDESAGTSFENPLVDFRAQLDLTATRYYALDPTNGIIKTTLAGITEYHAKGFAMLNSYGLRLEVFSRSGRNAVGFVVKQAQGGKKVLSRLNDREWEFIDAKTALLEAATNDTIHYDVQIKYFKRRIQPEQIEGLYDGLSDDEEAAPASGRIATS